MIKRRVLIPLPNNGCDPSEVAIPWKSFVSAGLEVVFATPDGNRATTDNVMLTGEKLGVFKYLLAARADAVEAYMELQNSDSFCNPINYEKIEAANFNAIYLPGGHDKPVKEYLESEILQNIIVDFFEDNKPVGAICHGVVLVARSVNSRSGKSVIYDYKTTSLLKKQEMVAYAITRLWMKDYYLTYKNLAVEDEVKSVLRSEDNFIAGPTPILKDTPQLLARGFFVRDRNYISARWPGDLYNFTQELIRMI